MNRASHTVLAIAVAGLALTDGGAGLSPTHHSSPAGPHPPAAKAPLQQSPTSYSAQITQICARALLFEGTHSIGTREGAIAVAQDIGASADKRLNRADDVPKPQRTRRLAKHWITIERRLTDMYANNYLRIWTAIERAHTPQQKAQLPANLRTLVDQPRTIEQTAAALERTLHVPDCTGGTTPGSSATPAPPT
jgi:hypothetical protein